LSVDALLVLMGVGAFLVAVWIDYRFPDLSPRTIRGTLLHLLAALALGNFLVPPVIAAVADDARLLLAGVFGIGFTVLVYLFLAGVWLIRFGQRTLGGSVR
jgi:hypothetical protein